ncbi:MAG: hypothetical protein BV456_04765 [Thermoplasmata archaeon M8B2D]|nr:MAG: hypothetical protein BV456_04765 [Thermoplasmata archaeon M8B2D]
MKKIIIFSIICLLLLSSNLSAFGMQIDTNRSKLQVKTNINYDEKEIEIELSFSDPEIIPYGNYSVVRVEETNHNKIVMFDYDPGKPVLPVNISVFKLEFGSKIIDVDFEYSNPEIINLTGFITFGKAAIDGIEYKPLKEMDMSVYKSSEPYPLNWVSYNTGGGLSYGERTTYFVVRIYPVRYFPMDEQLQFIRNIHVHIIYEEPTEPIIQPQFNVDLLILSPSKYVKYLNPLVTHKNENGIETKLFSLEEINSLMKLDGRDQQEKIKYFIKQAIEKWDIKYVLLIGGINGQTSNWTFPIRYSQVVPPAEQEYPEPKFISDLYFADIFNGEGKFSSWDSNGDNQFSVWNATFIEEMDLYPDVYLGRLPCRNTYEVKAVVNKIVNYETGLVADKTWFKNLVLVAGDSYVNTGQWPDDVVVNEGELAGESAVDVMPGFNPLRVYATKDDINRETVNAAIDKGAGFAYFCGHGSTASWNTHFEPATNENWCTGYNVVDMISLKNSEKLPVTVVGGCHNGQFDRSILMNLKEGLAKNGLKYIWGRFLWDGWIPNCWAWWLTSKSNGGAIATISNTGLGTHGDGDQDYNGVADYIEILDGWLELRFLELYGKEHQNILGLNYGETLTNYLNRFLGDEAVMDTKMVQQWELFGDPSLNIGGYD